MKFYPGDWVQDTATLTLAARGAWIDLLAAMWRSKPRGKLTLDVAGYARLLRADETETRATIAELSLREICETVTDANGNVTLVSRRMTREEKHRESTRYRVERFRNAHETPPSNASVTAQKSEVRSQKSEEDKNKRAQAPRSLSHFIKPTTAEITEYGKSIGFLIDGEEFFDHYEANGWIRGKTKIKDWKACVRTWRKNNVRQTARQTRKPFFEIAREKKQAFDRDVKSIVLSLETAKKAAAKESDYQDAITAMSDKYRDAPGTLKEALEIIKGRQRSLVNA